MGRRIDYLDDPDAPAANSIVPSANAAVFDGQGRLLLICRSDNGNWAMPGGAMDPGEHLAECAVRETLEETGIHCEVTGLVGMYTDPGHLIYYTSDGECRQECSFVFRARATGGEPTPSSESTQVVWVAPEDVGEYRMHPSMALRVRHALEERTEPYLG
ncbi:NUDIX domain-containing protein [Nocardiopsis algeriensis]|uniref:8-oxo-dGTP pyrophosphatase MutT (NUDIX family) n=1 Tax=Nocardiopsis algeriensis TaxID=1478215 RepID=A0A841IMQ9_9ACTN|nr:8-oxo-dGTP pyrophosphatase MutT (NUDIX family) [Nocardiopsis algeriensis]